MDNVKNDELKSKLALLFKDDKLKKLIIILGIGGIVLLFLSTFFTCDSGSSETGDAAKLGSVENLEGYKEQIESSLCEVISKIDGAGKTEIFLTLENGSEKVYALNNKASSSDNDGSADESSEAQYFTVRASDGSEQGLLLKILEPQVRGVVVVCQGGGDSIIRERVLEAVTKALDISSAKVCVTKLSQQTEE